MVFNKGVRSSFHLSLHSLLLMHSQQYNAKIASNPYIVGSFACIGGGLFGLDISSMSGVLENPYYKDTFGNVRFIRIFFLS